MSVKYKGTGCPTISYTIGTAVINKALLDLGSSINLLPYSICKQLWRELKVTNVTLQLADSLVKVLLGEIADVLIKASEFIFPGEIVVLETASAENPRGQIPMILGRPFLATLNALINCRSGLMKLTFSNMIIDLNIFNLGNQPSNHPDQPFDVNWIQGIPSEHFKDDGSDIKYINQEPDLDEVKKLV